MSLVSLTDYATTVVVNHVLSVCSTVNHRSLLGDGCNMVDDPLYSAVFS